MTAVLAQAADLNRYEAAFVGLVDRALANPALLVVALGAAFGVGAIHALAPGHGKAVAAAYLVGGRGRVRDALLLGGVVAAMHSVSVVVLALGLQVFLQRTAAPAVATAQVTPVLRVISGLVVVGLGVALLGRQRHRHTHADPALPPDVEPFSRRGLIALGLSGGLLPSPSAFLVLVTTAFSGRLILGLLLVLVFSLGLATTLTLIGVAVVRGRDALVDRFSATRQRRLLRVGAVAGAVVILTGGVVMTAAGVLAM
jgi:ABC-type nickel/cobalt efflux system permease component RcnA